MPLVLPNLVRIGLAMLLLVGMQAHADTYTYDPLGNLSTLSSDRGTRSFTYDELNRLKTEAGFTGTRAHAYDANTNRSTNGAAPPTLVTYTPSSNRIATLNGITVTFDAAGNLLADDLYTYTWDEVGRLKTVSKSGTLLATYTYDYRNRRSRKTTTAAAPQGAQTILYHYDQDDHLIAETRSDGTPLRTYVWLGELPITIVEHSALSTPPRTLHLQHDHLGTPRLAKNDTGVIQWRWDSDGYGASAPTQDPDGDGKYTSINLRFPGQYYDQESGLHYNWNRYYAPRLGRYISSDPIGLEGGSNTYSYVEGNPLSLIDPEGLLGRGSGAQGGRATQVIWNGLGNTDICSYYDEMASKNPNCSYYKDAANICRGRGFNGWLTSGVVRAGITDAANRAGGRVYESAILNNIRSALIEADKKNRQNGNTDSNGCVCGNAIDAYHNRAFSGAGVDPSYYGGNNWLQSLPPNPVPLDPSASPYDPRRLWQ